MEKRAILAISLAVLVLIGFRFFEQQRRGPSPAKLPAVQNSQNSSPNQGSSTQNLAPVEVAPQLQAPSGDDTQASARTITVEGDLYRAVIDNRGAVLTSWELKKYKSARSGIFEMIASNHDNGARSYPGSLIFEDAALTSLANNEFYQVSIEGAADTGAALAPPVTVAMKLKRGDLRIEKRYQL